jgi:MFS family permease
VRKLFQSGGFRRLLAGQGLATAAHQVAGLALPTLAITRLHAGPLEVGLLAALGFLPSSLLGLVAGLAVDRLPRRELMVGADLGRLVILALVAAQAGMGSLAIGHLYAAAAICGVLALVFEVAYQSHVPDLVDAELLPAANSALEVNRSAGTVLGPAIAGSLLGWLGAALTLIGAAAALAGSLAILVTGRRPPATRIAGAGVSAAGLRDELLEGLRAVFDDRRLRAVALCTATSNLGAFAFWSVGLVFAYRTLGLAPVQYGLAAAIGNLGLLAGAGAAAPLARRLGMGKALFASEALLGASMLATPLAVFGAPLLVLAATQLVMNFQVPVYNVNQLALRQAVTPVRLQGRMNSVMRTVALSTVPLGSLAGGALATLAGPSLAMAAGGAVACCAPLWLLGMLSLDQLPAGRRTPGNQGSATTASSTPASAAG